MHHSANAAQGGVGSRAPRQHSLAAVQMASGPHVEANLEEAARHIGEAAAQGAELVALPENFAIMGYRDTDKLHCAEPDGEGPIQAFLAEQARRHRVTLVGGTIPLQGMTPERVRPACLVYGPDGRRVACYDKIHLFDVEVGPGEAYRESATQQPGSEPVVLDTPVGRVGLAICYDLRFPELFRALVAAGAELLVVPSAFTAVTGEAHWHVLVRARAIENLCYVVAPDQGGYHVNGRETHGESMIVDPWGRVLGSLERGSGVMTATASLDRIDELRERFPVLHHRKL
ncbi:MAG: carbon-nitrogen hydrolase family protein [Halorhodospira sp.]